MKQHAEIVYDGVEENKVFNEIINKVINKCFENEYLEGLKLYISITLTTPEKIRKINKKYREIDKETDVLSFPMFEKEEIETFIKNGYEIDDVLGDIIISIDRVRKQAEEYGHSFERELSYMCVHGFFHLMGYDHIKDEDKVVMRAKEDEILNKLNITRN